MNKKNHIPIYHIAGMARSGETMLLHILSKNSSVNIVHNMRKKDRMYEEYFFRYLSKFPNKSINRFYPLALPYKIKKNDVLIIKQGVWEHRYPFFGIILTRNPLSIFSSLREYDSKNGMNWEYNWKYYRLPRLISWLKDIDKSLIISFKNKSPIEQFCLFYNRRMSSLAKLNHPIIRYEELVLEPEIQIKKICEYFKIDYEEKMLFFDNKNKIGHGKFDPNRSIDTKSIEKYFSYLNANEMDLIIESTRNISNLFGYKFNKNRTLNINY